MAFHRRSINIVTVIPSALLLFVMLLMAFPFPSRADIPKEVAQRIKSINAKGEYYGLIVSGQDELRAVLAEGHEMFQPDQELPSVDASGTFYTTHNLQSRLISVTFEITSEWFLALKLHQICILLSVNSVGVCTLTARRFHVGRMGKHRAIVVMCGSGMVNAAQTTQLLVSFFRVRAVLHYGRAASANPDKLSIGDVAIPRQFAHAGIFYWEKYGGDDESYDRNLANLTFSKYNVGEKEVANKLQSVYFQPEVIYSAEKPEVGKERFWIDVDNDLYATAQKIENVELNQCVGKSRSVCLEQQPKVKRVERGGSANIYVNNEAYRDFLRNRLNINSIDTESAAIAMACQSERRPFVALRSITNYAGGSYEGNDVELVVKLWPEHARSAVGEMFNQLPSLNPKIRSVTDA
ncbi:hypothetical protein KI387_043267 [Taxus chinensis]|uniref:Nucleoside phosphorylase domain-containing protein n=1 Tax=Taxus chinensis TaxID=29808 RepID=A0AA38C6Z0_TAXCH|nr:hypothetical protein KI387_043267 [Taxus chinensis]